jgi:hypothetical protein
VVATGVGIVVIGDAAGQSWTGAELASGVGSEGFPLPLTSYLHPSVRFAEARCSAGPSEA